MSSIPRSSGPRSRRVWFKALQQVHLWGGLILCLPLVMLGITGSILVFEHELERLFEEKPAYSLAVGEPAAPSAILAAARAAAPEGMVPSMLMLPREAGQPATVRLAQPGRGPGPGGRQMLIDPVSLTVLATPEPSVGILRQIFLLHANLLVRDRSGREIVGWLGVGMLALGISGLVLWWPRPGRLKAALTVKKGARGLRLHRDLHGAVGFWTLALFVVVTFSGVYLAFPQTTGAAVSALFPARDLRAPVSVKPVQGTVPATLDQSIEAARVAVPEARVTGVGLPQKPDQPYRVMMTPPGHEDGAPAITAFVDPWTGPRVAELRDPRAYSVGETIMAWQRALHAGQGLGWSWKILVFLSGVLPPLFAVTGTAMWLLKRRARRAQEVARAAALSAAE
ncbi:PepSY-associated TM helix domain-containing protein [Azospirillum sp. SYSU D00513]|uniref:PepSY-associated TM helix domain-containing protein n=1 Tax=Azospirillum sp. SYSU D00513 TaxID=2812561 RepID=UPI001B3BF582|nr:PepSY-associated TM helix domain-containing protein [Azospirillum sp. SYSU D00513]